jgi:putative transposase
MKKTSQIQSVEASVSAVPERVSVAMSEIAENMGEGLLALAVGAGLQVMAALMEADVAALAGPKGRHDGARTAVRHGRERGSVTLGGRRVPVTRPRVRTADGSAELAVAAYELFSSTEILGKMAMEKMLAGLSTRRYPVGLEPVGQQVAETSSATSKSAVSRRFVAMTQTALAELLAQDLSGLDLVALMIDGVHFAESCCIVALGVDLEGHQASAGIGRGLDRERHAGHRAAGGPAGAGPGCHPPDAGRPRRLQGPAQGGARRARSPGRATLPTA